jgi:hypothetical protein
LRIEVVNGLNNICYCIFSVYLVTGTKNPDISEEGTFRISKLFFYITTRGTLKDNQTRFLGPFHWTHIVSQAAVVSCQLYFDGVTSAAEITLPISIKMVHGPRLQNMTKN